MRLVDAAFGSDPGRWPLAAASTPRDHWLRAVVAGGQGRYASAFTDLDILHRTRSTGPYESLAHSTRASFLRQLGWHERARHWDGQARASAGDHVAAGADALIGLAADALGVGRFEVSARLLRQAQDLISESADDRLLIRLGWVAAELSMFSGAGDALAPAERAVDIAARFGSARHVVKSDAVLAAALCAAGRYDRSRAVADAALDAAGQFGLVPLRWALACLLADIGSAATPLERIVAIRGEAADAVRRRGGAWSTC